MFNNFDFNLCICTRSSSCKAKRWSYTVGRKSICLYIDIDINSSIKFMQRYLNI